MADENQDLTKLYEQVSILQSQIARLGGSTDVTGKALSQYAKDLEKRSKFEKMDAAEKKKYAQQQVTDLKKLHDQYKNGVISLEEFNEQTTEVTNNLALVRKGLDATTKAAVQRALQDVKNVEITREAYATLAKSTKELAINLTKQAFSAYSGVLKGIQSGANGIQSSAAMMSADLDMTNAGIQGMSSMAGTAGMAMMGMGGKARVAGIGLTVLSQAAGLASSAFTALEKFKIEFYAKEIEKSFEGFKTLSASGVMLGDGLMGLRKEAQGTGLAMATLANIQKNNQQDLSAAGLGAVGGFKLMTKTFKQGGEQFKQSLLNLGFDFEEQGELVSKTMAQMRRAGADPNKADMQSATKDYAANLRLIADITGKDAKAKMEEAKKAATNAAARAKILKMQREGDKDAQKRFEAQYAVAAAQGLGDAFMQKFASSDMQGRGGVVTDSAFQVANSTTGGKLDEKLNEMTQTAKDGNQSMKDFNERLATNTGKTNELLASESFASGMEKIAEASVMSGAATATKISEFFIKTVTPALEGIQGGEAGKKAAAEVQAQLYTTSKDQLQLNNLIIAGEKNRLALEVKAAEGIVEYSRLMGIAQGKILELINKMDSPFSYLGSKLGDLAMIALTVVSSFGLLKGGLSSFGKLIGIGATATVSANALSSSNPTSPGEIKPTERLRDAKGRFTTAEKLAAEGKIAAPGGKIASTVATDVAKVGGVTAAEEAAKTAAKTGAAKGLGKAVLSKLPGIGLVIGLAGAGMRVMKGDYVGAGLEAASGVASTLPGLGTAASIGLSGALIAKDMGAFDRPKEGPTTAEVNPMDPLAEENAAAEEKSKTEQIKETTDKQLKINETLLIETKKTNELLAKQNKLAEEAMEHRKALIDHAETQVRKTSDLIAATE